jgi:hypothetical protein
VSALNFAALTAHQYEEHEDPGYFPGQFNRGVLHSKEPDRFPLNTNTALIVNVPLAYTLYVLPIVFPKQAPSLSYTEQAPARALRSLPGWQRGSSSCTFRQRARRHRHRCGSCTRQTSSS